MLRLGSITIVLGLLACATSASTQPAVAPEQATVVAEPELEPADGPRKLTPTDNNAETLLAAADRITRVEICDVETGEPIATLPPALLDKLRTGLRDGAISEGLSSEAAWSMILRIEVEGRREPFIVQFVTVALRVKPEDAWSLAIADEAGEIDWRIRDIYVDYEIELDNEFEALVPDAEPQRYGEDAMPRPE
jgi:hypothetical protein